MEDQIKDFEDMGISAVKLHVSCDEKTLEEIAEGKYRVIFGSAEAVLDERFREKSNVSKRNQTCFLCLEEKTQREKVVDSLIFRKD